MAGDPLEIALNVARVLEQQGIRYVVGGSLASSISGEPRSTLDVDLVAELFEDQVTDLLTALGEGFYSDAESIRRAIRDKSSVNLIHLATSIKIDLFIKGGTPVDDEQMDRRQRLMVATDPDRYLYVYTPEDILLQKLRWFRLGNETSDRQWRDVRGILLVQGADLDLNYVRRAARVLNVSDLLERALAQAGDRG